MFSNNINAVMPFVFNTVILFTLLVIMLSVLLNTIYASLGSSWCIDLGMHIQKLKNSAHAAVIVPYITGMTDSNDY